MARKSPSAKTGNTGGLVIYETGKSGTRLDVTLKDETVWLTQKQMSELFQKRIPTINFHINNIFKERELERKSVIRKYLITASDGKTYETAFYNLDVIISVGYRVKSKRGTLFRQWALKILRDHIVKGYTINQSRLRENRDLRVKELQNTIALLQKTMYRQELTRDEAVGLLHIITGYSRSWLLLDQYDRKTIAIHRPSHAVKRRLKYEESKQAIDKMRTELARKKESGNLFGVERNKGLQAILGNIEQTFDGRRLYETLEEQAAHLLYFIIKDHPFIDGNKRIGAFLFILFLSRNEIGNAINSNALVAITLLAAESRPEEKEVIIALITNLLG